MNSSTLSKELLCIQNANGFKTVIRVHHIQECAALKQSRSMVRQCCCHPHLYSPYIAPVWSVERQCPRGHNYANHDKTAEYCVPVAAETNSNSYWAGIRAPIQTWQKTVHKDGHCMKKITIPSAMLW